MMLLVRRMLLLVLLVTTSCPATLAARSTRPYEVFFQLFNSLYFSSGLQFGAGTESDPLVWVEGNLQPRTETNCGISTNTAKKCYVRLQTGIVRYSQADWPNRYIRLNGCTLSLFVHEVEERGRFVLSAFSSGFVDCEAHEVRNGEESKVTADLGYLKRVLNRKLQTLTFKYDKSIDSYPIQPLRDQAMRQIIGYIMHSAGRVKQ